MRICFDRFSAGHALIKKDGSRIRLTAVFALRDNDTGGDMVHTVVDGTYRQTNLTNESPEYLAKREELRLAEIDLMRQRERVADLRRNLPEGAPIQDYQFEEGPRDLNAGDAPVRTVRLSELFTKPDRSLVIYHFMFGKKQTKACPMCTAWLDSCQRRRPPSRSES